MCETRFLCAATAAPAATQALAAALADYLVDGDLIVLSGDLGAGKTCFTQGLGAGLGVRERITSPTFTLASVYDGRLRLNHLDVYRLDDVTQALDLDLSELAEQGVTVIEWGEKIAAVLPKDRLTIDFRYPPVTTSEVGLDQRTLRLLLAGPSWIRRTSVLAEALEQWTTSC